MNFLVIVTCATAVGCPLTGPMKSAIGAANVHECRSTVERLITYYKYDPKKFNVRCHPTK